MEQKIEGSFAKRHLAPGSRQGFTVALCNHCFVGSPVTALLAEISADHLRHPLHSDLVYCSLQFTILLLLKSTVYNCCSIAVYSLQVLFYWVYSIPVYSPSSSVYINITIFISFRSLSPGYTGSVNYSYMSDYPR